ncbi:MAG: ABC transporter substrate-binding protein [Haloechinothrix sp.]
MKQWRVLAGAGVASVLVLGAACSGGTSAGDAGSAAALNLVDRTSERSEPVDQVKWLLAKEPTTFDTDRSGGDTEDTVVANVCERLFQLQPDLSVRPWLASAVEHPDEETMVLTLRTDVTFHDGSPMTADDVVYSLRRHAKEGARESDEFGNVAAISKTGGHEVTLELSQPDAQLETALAADAGIVFDEQTVGAQGEDYGSPGSVDGCSGSYRVASWKAGSSLVLERYDEHWGGDVESAPQRVTFTWADSAAAVNNLSTGSVDGTYLPSPALVPALQKSDKVTTYFGPSTMVYSLVPTQRGGMTDARLRRALSLAIDRAGIAKAGFQGYAMPWKLPVGPAAWGYHQDGFQQAYDGVEGTPAAPTEEDLTAARALVDEAGAPAEPVVIASDGSPYRTVMANAVKGAAQKIGLRAEITTLSEQAFDEFYTDPQARSKVDLVPVGWYISKPDPVGFYDNMVSGSGNNWIDFSDADYDEAIRQAAASYEEAERAELALRAQEIFLDEMLWIPLVQAPNTLALGSDLTGPPVSVAYLYYPWAAEIGRK